MTDEIQEVLISRHDIKKKVRELAERISEDYRGKRLVLVGVLKGAFIFLADLARELSIPVDIDLIAVSSYGPGKYSSGVVMMLKDLDISIEGKHVLIVEDIIDTGLTLEYLSDNLMTRGPASVRTCALLYKPEKVKAGLRAYYTGFSIPDLFVVGYGLDFNEKYRQLADICVLRQEAHN